MFALCLGVGYMPEVLLMAVPDVAEAHGISNVHGRRESITSASTRRSERETRHVAKILNTVGLKVSVLAA